MINLSFIGRETIEVMCPLSHKKKVIYTMDKARLRQIKTAFPMHLFGEPKDKPSAERRQQNLDRLALRIQILAQRLEDGFANTWMERTREKSIAEGAARPVLRDTTAMTTDT